jgi:hypothetical protein
MPPSEDAKSPQIMQPNQVRLFRCCEIVLYQDSWILFQSWVLLVALWVPADADDPGELVQLLGAERGWLDGGQGDHVRVGARHLPRCICYRLRPLLLSNAFAYRPIPINDQLRRLLVSSFIRMYNSKVKRHFSIARRLECSLDRCNNLHHDAHGKPAPHPSHC